jgi:L-threonylcarbamoyladenylate synthase
LRETETFERCVAVGGVAVFGADTVYGLACDPAEQKAVGRLYAMKGRAARKPAAVMFFDRSLALDALPEVGERTRGALERLLPGAVTLLLPNPAGRWPLACAEDPDTLGLRVPVVTGALAGVRRPVLQTSANLAGGPEARRLEAVPASIRQEADLLLDAGELPGVASTVLDLRAYEDGGGWRVLREGAVPGAVLGALL